MASKVDARLMKSTKFPLEFSQKVDTQKVNMQVVKKWIEKRITEILKNEDDVLIEMCFNLLAASRWPDIKSLQIQLTGFLDKDTAPFCKELWNLLLSAQSSPKGVPKELLEAKKLELMQERMDAGRSSENTRGNREGDERNRRQGADTWQAPARRGDRAGFHRGRGGRAADFGHDRQRSPSPGRRGRGPRDTRPRPVSFSQQNASAVVHTPAHPGARQAQQVPAAAQRHTPTWHVQPIPIQLAETALTSSEEKETFPFAKRIS
ncbi:hypothetical protein RJ55_00361 [Drechmeria coniospora]|nr:hypothetical protein RJ55_00361 [Drechmeria coniospora]